MDSERKRNTILHCIDSLGRGGAENLLKDTLPLLPEYNHIICYFEKPDTLLDQFKKYTVYFINYNSRINFFSAVNKVKRVIRDHDVSIIHSHLIKSTFIARFATNKNVKFFFSVHSILSEDAFKVNRISLWTEKLTYKKWQTIIGVSAEVVKDYDKWVGIKGKAFVLYNYIKDVFFDAGQKVKNDRSDIYKIVAVGNLKKVKNYDRLLEAMALLKDIPVILDIYGSGTLEHSLRDKIETLRIPVRLMGSSNDVASILKGYDAFILPSLYEGFGIAPMEALAAGLPVMLSNLDVFKEVIEDAAKYFNPESATDIANAIRYGFSNRAEMLLKAEKGKQLVSEKASKKTYESRIREIYNS